MISELKTDVLVKEDTLVKKPRKIKKNSFKCEYVDCNYDPRSEIYIKDHKEFHKNVSQKYECNDCDLKFLSLENFENHEKDHPQSTKRLVECNFPGCNKKYTTIYNRDVKKLFICLDPL